MGASVAAAGATGRKVSSCGVGEGVTVAVGAGRVDAAFAGVVVVTFAGVGAGGWRRQATNKSKKNRMNQAERPDRR